MSKKRDICEICGKELSLNSKESINRTCYFCNRDFSTNIYCPDGHYICDDCHSRDAIKTIETYCEKTDLKNPFLIANKIMRHPNFKVYGNEHHALVPAAILTALKNNGIRKPNGKDITFSDIQEAIRRGSKIPGGWCGFYGACGAGIGSGVAISIFTEATPSTEKPRSLANIMTSRSLSEIADDLEHCCKRSVIISIAETLSFLSEKFGIKLDYDPESCVFSEINEKCEKGNCPIYSC